MEATENETFEAADPSKKSKSERKEEGEIQEFSINYQREHTIAYLYKKMPYNFMVIKRILYEVK